MSSSLSRPVLGSMYVSFLLMGIVGGLSGMVIPFLRQDFHLNHGEAGLLFSAQSTGSLVILVLGGWLVHVLGKRRLLFIGSAAFAAGMGASALAPDFSWVLAGNVLLGAGMSFLDIGISTLCIDANREGKGKALNLLHFYFGAGAVLGPLLALALGPLSGGWRWAFALVGLGPLVVACLVPFLKMPESPPATAHQKFAVYRRPFLWLGAAVLFVYCGVEWGIGAWFPSYWKEIPAAAGMDPAWATSAFWLTFAIGRLVVGSWADKWGFQRFLTATMAAAVVLVVLWILFPQPQAAFVWVLLFGFVIAGQYPTFVALISHRYPESSGQVTSLLSVFASLGTLLWPPAIGVWADAKGIEALPWAQLALALVMAALAAATFVVGRNKHA
jgi:MFS family permease